MPVNRPTTTPSALVHANLNWTLGPFKYVLASPVFQRWHHTALERGGLSDFAGTFPIWNLMFGTFSMPANALPDAYSIDDKSSPEGFGAKMLYPVPALTRAPAPAARVCISFTYLQSNPEVGRPLLRRACCV